jgi:hypothetical protein
MAEQTQMPAAETLALAQTLTQMIHGHAVTQAVNVAVTLGLPERLQAGPRSSADLAAETGTVAPALDRLLRYLARLGLLRVEPPDRFALTPLGALLQPGSPLRGWAILNATLYWPAYGALLEVARTGQSGFQRVFGMPIHDYLAAHPEIDAAYTLTMTGATTRVASALATAYDFSGCRTVVDVGGGEGALLAAVLAAHPHLRGVLFDRPAVVAGAGALLATQGVAERCAVEGGDFFAGVPAGGDVYLLKWVLPGLDDERAVTVLRHCARAMAPGGRVLVIDPLGRDAQPLHYLDLDMLVVWDDGGGMRDVAQLATLFQAAGLRLERVIATPTEFSIVEGRQA